MAAEPGHAAHDIEIDLPEEWLLEPAIAPAPLDDRRIANNGAVLVKDVDEEEEANEFDTDENFSCATSNEADEPPLPLHQELFDTDENFTSATSNEADEPPPLHGRTHIKLGIIATCQE